LKVGDFGLACKQISERARRKSMCGTPNYIAPEILNCEGHSFEVDIWAFGVITYGLLIGRMPFETNNIKKTYTRISSCMYIFPDTEIPISAKYFLFYLKREL
jgi:polo-like kinase 1